MKPTGKTFGSRAAPAQPTYAKTPARGSGGSVGGRPSGGGYGYSTPLRKKPAAGGGAMLWILLGVGAAVMLVLGIVLTQSPVPAALARPRPADLNFQAASSAVQQYLANLPERKRLTEGNRISLIQELRGEWMHSKFAYEGNSKGIRLKDGTTVYGAVLTNEKGMVVLPGARGGKAVSLKWTEVPLDQYLLFLEDHIQQRVSHQEESKGQSKTGENCLKLAIVFDWYGRPDKAQKYARDAVHFNPSLQQQVESCFPALRGG